MVGVIQWPSYTISRAAMMLRDSIISGVMT